MIDPRFGIGVLLRVQNPNPPPQAIRFGFETVDQVEQRRNLQMPGFGILKQNRGEIGFEVCSGYGMPKITIWITG